MIGYREVVLLHMEDSQIHQVMAVLAEECRQWQTPSVTVVAEQYCSPFHVLVSCLISLRTKDAVTASASARLFSRASSVQEMVLLSPEEIAELIYPAGFYRTKARQILAICERLLAEYGGTVPNTVEELVRLNGVGRKTANLVVTLGYGKAGICVDVHVHRITNRWGYLVSRTPEQTEQVLRQKLPTEYWLQINDLLVCYGQNRCFPVTPACSECRLAGWCSRVGVTKSR